MRKAVLLLILLAGCVQEEPINISGTYFCQVDDCQGELVKLIGNSSRVNCAFFDLDLEEVIQVLDEADALVVVDNQNSKGLNHSWIRFDTTSRLSHNKFCVFDDRIVWTGSFNPTENGNSKNDNNVIVVQSDALARNYEDEFAELWLGMFGRGRKTERKEIGFVENYFCPEDDCKDAVMRELAGAKESVYFMTFSFTDSDIATLLIDLNDEGVEVHGVMEKSRRNMKSNQYYYLWRQGVDVKLDRNSATMHHKVFIIDKRTVITGSYNPTGSGNTRNDENILIVHDAAVAGRYVREFGRLYK